MIKNGKPDYQQKTGSSAFFEKNYLKIWLFQKKFLSLHC